MPLSWRIEKFILALWHFAVVFSYLSTLSTVREYKIKKWLVEAVGDNIAWAIGLFAFFYVIWQLGLFFLHMKNALTGEFYEELNYGTFRNFVRTMIYNSTHGIPNVGPTPYHNINRAIDFRESKMGAVGQSEAADILVKTAMLDAIASGAYQGHNARRAADNLNAKLGAMGQSDGLKYLMNKKD